MVVGWLWGGVVAVVYSSGFAFSFFLSFVLLFPFLSLLYLSVYLPIAVHSTQYQYVL